MEGQPEESDEDVQKEEKLTVLWENCIQQSIIVDLSEDESLHFSDLESLNLNLSQTESATSEANIHLSGSAELSALDDTSSESNVSNQSERVVQSKNKNSLSHLSNQSANTVQEELPSNTVYEDPGENTSYEDQEELPFDDDLGSLYFNQTVASEGNLSSDETETVHTIPDVPGLLKMPTTDINDLTEGLVSAEHSAEKPVASVKEDANCTQDNSCDAPKPNEVAPTCPSALDVNQVLLRHFSQTELLQAGSLIEAETLPEVSLLESVDDTGFSLALIHKSSANDCNQSESQTFDISQSVCSGITEEKSKDASENSSSDSSELEFFEAESNIEHIAPAAALWSASTDLNESSKDNSAEDVMEEERAAPLVRTRSFSEIKYGQGQVHYPLPDFSKVAPKVKIPKASSGPARSVPQSPRIMHRAQSSPGMLDVVSRVLEDSVLPPEKPYVFTHEDKQTPPALVHHLQAEYDKLLTKYAEAENLIDQMRLGTSTQTLSEMILHLDAEYHDQLNDDAHQGHLVKGGQLGSIASHLSPSESFAEKGAAAPQNIPEEVSKPSPCQADEGPSDGERMTAELNDIISQFIQKVKEFKLSVSKLSMSTAEQQMMLRSMMEAQDQLERKYISNKEEHRALEMQNYMGLSRNTGIFDPNRLVEGEIFRIGMHLEDIKEMIDENVCEQISSPQSSSTLIPMKEMLHVKPSPLMSTPSPTPSLHEGPSAGFSTAGYKMETWKEEDKEAGAKETSVVHGDGGLGQSTELVSNDLFLKHTGLNSCLSWSPQVSLEDQNIQTADGGERSSVLSEGIDHNNILACLSESLAVIQREPTPESSHNILDSVCNPERECVSLSVEVSSFSATLRHSETSSLIEPPVLASRIVSPETDSGFGSSYLNQSGSDPFQPNHLTESVHTHTEGFSSSDSEGSCSNLQTAIHSVSLTYQQRESPHPPDQTQSSSAAIAVECWVESTANEPSGRLQGSDSTQPARTHHHLHASVVSTTMDTEKRHSQSYCCSCNSEAIMALQSEVSRLKKDLMEGLVQLPYLSQKMDYLTSKYSQECRSKTRPQIHQTLASNSPTTIEDWISSDMDPSKSKDTDSGDIAGSKVMLQLYGSPIGGGRGSGVGSEPEFQCKPHQTLRFRQGTEGSTNSYGLTSSSFKERQELSSDNKVRQQTVMGFSPKETWSSLSCPSLQKPHLQVNYGSRSSLPASYKVREPPLPSTSHHRKRSSQSDTALLPSNVYFQQTPSPVSVRSKTGSRRGRRRGVKEDDMNRTLDQAIEVARSMKRTTERMAKRLSADLAKVHLNRKQQNVQYNHWGAGNTQSTDQLAHQSPPSI